jgi:glutamyl-tRNA synthetase
MGYLPEALMNFLGLLVAPAKEGEEKFDIPALIERLDLAKISLGGPVFDVAKLDWLNARYVHELAPGELLRRTLAWGFDRERVDRIVALAGLRVERLSDLVPLTAFLFAGESLRRALALAMWGLDAQRSFDRDTIEGVLKGVGETLGRKFRDLARVYYVAMTGSPTSLPLFESMELLGRDIVRERFRVALDVLGGVSGKEQKAWQARPAEVKETVGI